MLSPNDRTGRGLWGLLMHLPHRKKPRRKGTRDITVREAIEELTCCTDSLEIRFPRSVTAILGEARRAGSGAK